MEQLKTEFGEIIKSIGVEKLTSKLIEFATTSGFKLIAVIVMIIVGLKAIKWLKKMDQNITKT